MALVVPPPAALPSPTVLPLHRALGLEDDELVAIESRLGRPPNDLELAMFSVMWSEHCSYKSSRPWLRTLPTAGADVVAGPGENAGVVAIGDGLAVAFKLESHNHPSAVEPYQGAATGVGGILRDIFTMGARPIALLDALKFGDPAEPRTRHLVRGVVRGVGGYGNCVGVPTVGGELVFDPSYADNPLVNVMAIGLLDVRHLTRAAAPGPGNLAVLFGSATGRDGIGGASVLASASFDETSSAKRPTVQVGDPFAEKLLIEASLELIERGLLEGLQDLGAAGITCAVSETADRAGTGIVVDLDAIPRREPGMAPFEVMISESQERMLAIVSPEALAGVLEVCARWAIPAAVVGRVTADGLISVIADGVELARIPAAALTSDAIIHERRATRPARTRSAPAPGAPIEAHDELPERGMDPGAVLLALLGQPNLGSRACLTMQYDETVGTDTVAGGEHGAAVLRIKGTTKALVAATDACASVAAVDPWLGAAMAVAECTRNVAVTGARPLGVTNCLNFGDPTDPEAFWCFTESVRGLGDACRALGLPVTGGNVSFYNASPAGTIAPTAQIGIVGLLDDVERRVGPAFRAAGDVVLLLGSVAPGLTGSAYAALAGQAVEDAPPSLDLRHEAVLQRTLISGARERLLASAQDVSGGGLAVAAAECAIWSGLGAHLQLPVGSAPAVDLFGESPGRVLVSASPADWERLAGLAAANGLPVRRLGTVGGERLIVELLGDGATGAAEERGAGVADTLDVRLVDLERAWRAALPRALGEDDDAVPTVSEDR
ncbi:MAG: phosphoribosylformylglycinamidine synthase subunit PurL [Candidatus Limnocylindrales bacterium]